MRFSGTERIPASREQVWQFLTDPDAVARARVGNVYVNRNIVGAVVGVQPFGGEGLSGTGPKAGGPHYLPRFATEQTITVNTAAAGGNAALMAQESTFDAAIRSPANAIGLMQIVPATGRRYAKVLKIRRFTADKLTDPDCWQPIPFDDGKGG